MKIYADELVGKLFFLLFEKYAIEILVKILLSKPRLHTFVKRSSHFL